MILYTAYVKTKRDMIDSSQDVQPNNQSRSSTVHQLAFTAQSKYTNAYRAVFRLEKKNSKMAEIAIAEEKEEITKLQWTAFLIRKMRECEWY